MIEFDRATFTSCVANNTKEKATREAIFELLDFALNNAFKVAGGAGNGTFHYLVKTTCGTATLFYCASNGDVTMYFGSSFDTLTDATVSRVVRKLNTLSNAFEYFLRYEDYRSPGGCRTFQIKATLIDPKIMKGFQDAVLELQKEISKPQI